MFKICTCSEELKSEDCLRMSRQIFPPSLNEPAFSLEHMEGEAPARPRAAWPGEKAKTTLKAPDGTVITQKATADPGPNNVGTMWNRVQ